MLPCGDCMRMECSLRGCIRERVEPVTWASNGTGDPPPQHVTERESRLLFKALLRSARRLYTITSR